MVVIGEYHFLAKATRKTWEKVVVFQFYGETVVEAAAFS